MIELLRNSNLESDNDTSDQLNEEDEEETLITTEQYQQRANEILRKIKNYITTNNTTVQNAFKDVVYEAELDDDETITRVQVIDLKYFIPSLEQIGINLDRIDIYCIFTKLKIVDEFEAINVETLVKELEALNLASTNRSGLAKSIDKSDGFNKTSDSFNNVKKVDNIFDNNLGHQSFKNSNLSKKIPLNFLLN